MNTPAMAGQGWHPDLEPPVIGDAVYDAACTGPGFLGALEGGVYWERGTLGPVYLAGTDIPGDIRFDLAAFDGGPWWDADLMDVDLSWYPPDPMDVVEQIFGDLGRPPRRDLRRVL